MKYGILVYLIVCFFLTHLNASPQIDNKVIKIVPLGNSITSSNNKHDSYRFPLWKKLIDAGIAFDFVGSTTIGGNPSKPNYKGKSFDRDHEGHWGWTTDAILKNIEGWLIKYTPDMALLHLGTNDCIRKESPSSTIGKITKIIGCLRNDNPNVVIFLASVIPSAKHTNNIPDFNPLIPGCVEKLNTEESPVVFVDMASALTLADTYDKCHPNPVGEEKMAQKWFEAISAYLAGITNVSESQQLRADFSARRTNSHNIWFSGTQSLDRKTDVGINGNGFITNLAGKKIFSPSATEIKPSGVYITSDR
ncbi:MAG: SGNH/GDSL hydrolase family protein [Chitinispirillia bacterium]|jgi:hypothetical protein